MTSDSLTVGDCKTVGPHPLQIPRATRAVYGDVLNEEVAFNRHGLRRPLGENGDMESVKRHPKQASQLAPTDPNPSTCARLLLHVGWAGFSRKRATWKLRSSATGTCR